MKQPVRNESLGDYIRKGRESRKLSYYKAAEQSDLDHTYWRKLEAGQYEAPSPRALAAIAEVIDAPIGDLYALAGYAVPSGLPALAPYLRAQYQMAPDDIAKMESYFAFLRAQYGIPADQPVFPPKPQASEPAEEAASAEVAV